MGGHPGVTEKVSVTGPSHLQELSLKTAASDIQAIKHCLYKYVTSNSTGSEPTFIVGNPRIPYCPPIC